MTTATAHTEAAFFGLIREHTELPVIARFTIDGEPRSKARPRFGKGGRVYTPAETMAAERAVGFAFLASCPKGFKPDDTTTYGLMCLFFNGTRQRRDVDNMVKLISDGLNGIAWVDDSQVTELGGRKQHSADAAHARTEVIVYRTGIIERPKATCEQCGQMFDTYTSWGKRKYCTTACRSAHLRAHRERPCNHCGKKYVPSSSPAPAFCSTACRKLATTVELACCECGQKFRIAPSIQAQRAAAVCGTECRREYWRKHRLVAARGTCSQCGGPTSKKNYVRCRTCANSDRKVS